MKIPTLSILVLGSMIAIFIGASHNVSATELTLDGFAGPTHQIICECWCGFSKQTYAAPNGDPKQCSNLNGSQCTSGIGNILPLRDCGKPSGVPSRDDVHLLEDDLNVFYELY